MNTSLITPIQDTLQLAIEAGAKELQQYFGDANIYCVHQLLQGNKVKVYSTCNDEIRFTVIEYLPTSAEDILNAKDLHTIYYATEDKEQLRPLHDKDCYFCRFEDKVLEAMEEYANQFKSN